MILTLMAAAAVLSADPAPAMRVSGAGLKLSDRADAALFADRIAEQSRAFCAAHVQRITPEYPHDPSRCEYAMGRETIRVLPASHRRAFIDAGGLRLLTRSQR